MKKVFTICFILIGSLVFSQSESTSIGLRGGGISGFTVKSVDYNTLKAFELVLGYQKGGARLLGMIEKFRPIREDRIANLFIISGIGAHTGYITYDENQTKYVNGIKYYSYRKVYAPIIGADLMIGIEYHFESVPFNISLDYKPYMEFCGEKTFKIDFWDIGFSLRYRINN
jgi:hypothetical protein